jgi:uncharacterized protein (TIGR02265 family)
LGVKPEALLAAYPWEVWPDVVEVIAADRFPNLSLDQAVDALGTAFIDEGTGSVVARIVGPIARAIGVERMVARLGRAFKTTHNFLDTSYEKVDGGFLLHVTPNAESLPLVGSRRWDRHDFMAAAIRSGLRTFLKVNARVEVRKREGEAPVSMFITV